jgi:hypothetical protein
MKINLKYFLSYMKAMKKETFSNSRVVEQQIDEGFIKTLEQTTSVTDFYKHKEKILSLLKKHGDE